MAAFDVIYVYLFACGVRRFHGPSVSCNNFAGARFEVYVIFVGFMTREVFATYVSLMAGRSQYGTRNFYDLVDFEQPFECSDRRGVQIGVTNRPKWDEMHERV